jgi:hypothetical protein
MALDKCRNVTIELELHDRASSLPPAVVSGGSEPECSGCASLAGTQAECRNGRDRSMCGARGVSLIRVQQAVELTWRVSFMTRGVSFDERAYPHPGPPPLRRGGNRGSPPLSALSADGRAGMGVSGWHHSIAAASPTEVRGPAPWARDIRWGTPHVRCGPHGGTNRLP